MLADVNFNLSRFWTLIVALIGAPLLAILLIWGTSWSPCSSGGTRTQVC